MAEKPILFSGEMVRAILDGRKTVTRRVIKPQPEYGIEQCHWSKNGWGYLVEKNEYGLSGCTCNPVKGRTYFPGDNLWVRETFSYITKAKNEYHHKVRPDDGCPVEMLFKADADIQGWELPAAWTPSIFMPRWASRITLEVTAVRAERLQDISPQDCQSEGLPYDSLLPATAWREAFSELWDSINKDRGFSWDANPFVWVVEFKQVQP